MRLVVPGRGPELAPCDVKPNAVQDQGEVEEVQRRHRLREALDLERLEGLQLGLLALRLLDPRGAGLLPEVRVLLRAQGGELLPRVRVGDLLLVLEALAALRLHGLGRVAAAGQLGEHHVHQVILQLRQQHVPGDIGAADDDGGEDELLLVPLHEVPHAAEDHAGRTNLCSATRPRRGPRCCEGGSGARRSGRGEKAGAARRRR
mmetsp:Transcript_30928/g.88258  ORF Transcript_30928/g.88258 Transcript_30928/m.88258 type:complete len:204 (+) Transcript_30928:1173-1784(+)